MIDLVFYDRQGRAKAYCEDGAHIYLYSGQPVAYIDGDSLYAFRGHHLGWFLDGWIRDHHGEVVLFTRDASGGPRKPGKGRIPGKCAEARLPGKGGRAGRPGRPGFGSRWSSITPEDFFNQ
jgi:hypothetical protein